ncbi:MAG: 4-phosphoerythronate dehydrogenase [Bacteroidales bacterium]|nr:4-phosphoerythronate dehydrogenase [Bacteroidales bacterium]MDD4670167.1 4-phosphoerythronate dehydrogenase [Bacteroidales bacterium]
MKIVIDKDIPYIEGVFEPYADVLYINGSEIDNKTLTNANALIIRTRTKCNRALLHNTHISIIATATIGTDHIDMNYCNSQGIVVVNAPGCNSSAVRQYFFTALYVLARKLKMNLKDKTLGVIGVGHVGSKIADMGERLGFRVLRNDPPRQRMGQHENGYFVELKTLLSCSDIVTVHIPLSRENKNFAGEYFFDGMKPGAIFVNASRGDIVDEHELLSHINLLGGTVIDVWRNEPRINTALLLKADIATPHIAGYSRQGKINGTIAVVRAVARFFRLEELYDFNMEGAVAHIDIEGCNQDGITEVLEQLYPIMEDDAALRSNPGQFEQLRSEYNYRIEF